MSDLAAIRRFVCRACGYSHLAWAARCSACLSLEGLVQASDVAPIVAPLPLGVVEEGIPSEPSRPRLMIARAPSPEPSLEDPATELADVVDEESFHFQTWPRLRSCAIRRVCHLSIMCWAEG